MITSELLEGSVSHSAPASAWKSVLVPLDGSAASNWVLSRAQHILEQPGTSVTLLRVVDCSESRAQNLAYRTDSRHREIREALAKTRNRFVGPSVSVRAQLRFGDPTTEILREISEGHHDLVAMSTHGGNRIRQVLFGSVAERVLQSSPAPLLLYRPLTGWNETSASAETGESTRFRHLLVMFDGLEPAEEILPMATEVARAFGSELHLFGAVFGGSQAAAKRQEAEEYFKKCATSLSARGIAAHVHVSTGAVVDEALKLIHERGIDSVALMTHGRSGLARAVHESVAQRLIRESGVPILIWRNRRLRGPLPDLLEEHRQLWVD